MTTDIKKSKLDSLQALRAFACIAVVAHHVFRGSVHFNDVPVNSIMIPSDDIIKLGAAGVDLFFILSGFIMMYISTPFVTEKKTPISFIKERILRIWPTYVITSGILCMLLFKNYISTSIFPYDLTPYRLLSFIFIPTFNQSDKLQPILGPGWSLNYEMLFYIIFTLILFTKKNFIATKLFCAITLTFILGHYIINNELYTFLSNPIIFEFLIGVVIFKIYKKIEGSKYICICALTIGLYLLLKLNADIVLDNRIFHFGIPASLIFISFLTLPKKIKIPKPILFLGDASYSIYLTHTMIIYKIINSNTINNILEPQYKVISVSILAILVALIFGSIFYLAIENPMTKFTKKFFATNKILESR